jgi:hypothetical protein
MEEWQMEEELKTYKVVIELEVTAENSQEALENAVSDIKELKKDGTLEATITVID